MKGSAFQVKKDDASTSICAEHVSQLDFDRRECEGSKTVVGLGHHTVVGSQVRVRHRKLKRSP